MAMDYVSVPEAAKRLSLNPSRVRAMLAAGQLDGERLGGRWAIPVSSVAARQRQGSSSGGRPLKQSNAWAVLSLASGEDFELDGRLRRRLSSLLSDNSLCELAPRLRGRAAVHRFRAHPGVLRALSEASAVRPAGISAAGVMGFGLVAGNELDAYVDEADLADLVGEYALEPVGASDPSGNVVLRAVGGEALPYLADLPRAAVALDLSEQPDRRSARIGKQELDRLNDQQLWRSAVPASAAARP